MQERIIGPVRGYYVAVTALVAGELGDRYLGYARVYRRLPADFLTEGAVATVACDEESLLAEVALDRAEDLAFDQLDALPPSQADDESGPLWALAYVSKARKMLRAEEIAHLLGAARERNRQLGITGALLYFDESFMQYIEGPRSRLELVYRIIRRDPLHTGIIKLLKREVTERVFPDWHMSFDSPLTPLWPEAAKKAVSLPPSARPEAHRKAVLGMLSLFVQRPSVQEELVQAAARRK